MTKMKVKDGLAVAVFLLATFMVSGGPSYIFALAGLPVATQDLVAFTVTPVAFLLVLAGSFGLLTLSRLPKGANPRRKAWVRLAVGFGMALLAYIYLELLLSFSYTKQ